MVYHANIQLQGDRRNLYCLEEFSPAVSHTSWGRFNKWAFTTSQASHGSHLTNTITSQHWPPFPYCHTPLHKHSSQLFISRCCSRRHQSRSRVNVGRFISPSEFFLVSVIWCNLMHSQRINHKKKWTFFFRTIYRPTTFLTSSVPNHKWIVTFDWLK